MASCSNLASFYAGNAWNPNQADDPEFNALYESMKAADTAEELGNYAIQAYQYVVAQHWLLFGPVEPSYNVTQPCLKGHTGEFYMGVWNMNTSYVRLWIDQDLKKKLGF